ncbi:MAG: YtxH domain-containing protein [Bacteroidetes bacterium]|nr:YtxH domain-containing protein [Bacteroidota bacterium]MDA1118956.1 YtxH domain-containing protein [Bacteroidota bacterium]
MGRTTNTILAFLTGAATGVILGILYAPDKGSNTRDKLSFQLDKYRVKMDELLKEIMEGKELVNNSARTEGERVINDAKEKAEQLLEDVDELLGQIKKN